MWVLLSYFKHGVKKNKLKIADKLEEIEDAVTDLGTKVEIDLCGNFSNSLSELTWEVGTDFLGI